VLGEHSRLVSDRSAEVRRSASVPCLVGPLCARMCAGRVRPGLQRKPCCAGNRGLLNGVADSQPRHYFQEGDSD